MQEQWERWIPASNLASKYSLEDIFDTLDGFSILLSNSNDKKQKVKLTYQYSAENLRKTKIKYRVHTLNYLDQLYGKEFYTEWTFFTVKNSSYIQLATEQSYEMYNSSNDIHFSLITEDTIIDFIKVSEPIIEFIND